MSLIRPEITTILRNSGITPSGLRPIRAAREENTISDKLDDAGLSVIECFHVLRDIMDTGDTDTVKLNAVKTVLEAHKVMRGDAAATQIVNIIINDLDGTSHETNPIFIPRELQPSN